MNEGKKEKGRLPTGALAAKAEAARVVLARQGAVFRDEAKAEAEILERAIDLIKGSLPIICSKVEGFTHAAVEVCFPGVYLMEDGSFAKLEPGPVALTAQDVLDMNAPEDVIEGLIFLFEKQITGREASAQGVEKRVKKLRSILALLED